jgi:hypothetical protein
MWGQLNRKSLIFINFGSVTLPPTAINLPGKLLFTFLFTLIFSSFLCLFSSHYFSLSLSLSLSLFLSLSLTLSISLTHTHTRTHSFNFFIHSFKFSSNLQHIADIIFLLCFFFFSIFVIVYVFFLSLNLPTFSLPADSKRPITLVQQKWWLSARCFVCMGVLVCVCVWGWVLCVKFFCVKFRLLIFLGRPPRALRRESREGVVGWSTN